MKNRAKEHLLNPWCHIPALVNLKATLEDLVYVFGTLQLLLQVPLLLCVAEIAVQIGQIRQRVGDLRGIKT